MSGGREVLQPLADAQSAVRLLHGYQSADELRDSVVAVATAAEAVLRRMVRADAAAPDALRLNALSSTGVPTEQIVAHLRRRDIISIELAGMLHELESAARRAAEGAVHASDADHTVRTVARLTREAQAFVVQGGSGTRAGGAPKAAPPAGGRAPAGAAAATTAHGGRDDDDAASDDDAVAARERRRHRRLMFIAGTVFMLGGLAMLVSLLRGTGGIEREAIAAFRAERYGVAEAGFRSVLERDADHVTAMLYLGRIYRVQGRMDEAAEVLRTAAARAPQDADVSRELGHLFMDLRRPESAVPRFREAVELDPAGNANWIALIQALRAAGDPAADEWLQRAPDEVRAAMTAAPPQAPYRSP